MAFASAHAAQSVATVRAVSESDQVQRNLPLTFGQIFADGDVPAGTRLKAELDGQTIPIQVDRKATDADGSLRHAIVTLRVPTLSASGQRLITLFTSGTSPTAKPVTLDDLLATKFDAKVSLTVGDTTYKADARRDLEQAKGACRPWSKRCNLWMSGPLASEWIVGGPVRSLAGSSPHLAVYFYVRAYAGDPIDRVRVNIVIENDWAWAANPHDITYDARLTAGRHVYAHKHIDHYAHTRWHHVLWWGKPVKVYAKLDGAYVHATGAVSQYGDVHPTKKLLNHVRQHVAPMARGDQAKDMHATGAQGGIGPLPRWTTAYVQSMNRYAFRWMLANDDAAGSYAVFYRDKATGRPVSILNYPRITIAGDRGHHMPHCGGTCDDPWRASQAHEPSIGYLSYMVTGDYYYLEQLQFWADWNVIWMNASYRNYAKGLLHHNQVRAQAWNMRTLGDAAYITPDHDPLKSYFVDMMRDNLEWYNQHYTQNSDSNKLGIIIGNTYALHYDKHTSLAPWQDDFFTWTADHLADLGFNGAKGLLRFKAEFAVGRMIAPGFCYVYGSAYTLKARDARGKPLYDTFKEMYRASVSPKVAKMQCASEEMAANIRKGRARIGDHFPYHAGDMWGYPTSPVGYPAKLQMALAAAVDSGIDGAAQAWSKYTALKHKPDFIDQAEFDVVPRIHAPLAPPQIEFYASPNPVKPGQPTTLHWTAVNARNCSGKWMSGTATSGRLSIDSVQGATNFNISCSGEGGTAETSVRVADTTVDRPSIKLKASPSTVPAGGVSVLSWDASNSDYCAASGGWSGAVMTSGKKTVGPLTRDTKYVVECSGGGGDIEQTVLVRVQSVQKDTVGAKSDGGGDGGGGAFGLFAYIVVLAGAGAIRRRRAGARNS
jgi:hypothetical protein